ncbi:hypothetical protein LTR28_009624 [Elasticomyces elasticus]|nr:hypothetical protein LTR28_009624 [Elasticomyces elasticus]
MALLWVHVHPRRNTATVCLGIATSLWIAQHIIWTGRIWYRNRGMKEKRSTIVHLQQECGVVQAMHLKIPCKEPREVLPGQYVYLTVPEMVGLGRVQAHPYMIAWVDGRVSGTERSMTLLIQCRQGFSDALRLGGDSVSTVVDGPWGGSKVLKQYDKVLLIASGIGIAAHLIPVRYLLQAHEDQSARVRRITMIWFLETSDQELWAKDFLRQLLDMDHRSILTIILYLPQNAVSHSREMESSESNNQRMFRFDYDLDLTWTIEKEWKADAGNMALSGRFPESEHDKADQEYKYADPRSSITLFERRLAQVAMTLSSLRQALSRKPVLRAATVKPGIK